MTDDIVARLRKYANWQALAGYFSDDLKEAADDIEQLRAALRLLIEWHDDTGAVMLPVLIDIARAALAGEKNND
jgi:hypothetical protein